MSLIQYVSILMINPVQKIIGCSKFYAVQSLKADLQRPSTFKSQEDEHQSTPNRHFPGKEESGKRDLTTRGVADILHSKIAMPEVKLVFKCGVLTPDGQIDPDGYKFLTWSYVTDLHTGDAHEIIAGFSHSTLAQRVQAVYPEIPEPNRIVFIGKHFQMIVSTTVKRFRIIP